MPKAAALDGAACCASRETTAGAESLRARSMKTCRQYLRSASSCCPVRSANPWNMNGVSVQGRSSSAMYMPNCSSPTGTFFLRMRHSKERAPQAAMRTGIASQVLTCIFRRAYACAVPRPQLPLPMAGGSPHLVGVRDGEPDPRLVRALDHRVGGEAGAARGPGVARLALLSVLRRARRPPRFSLSPLRHARRLRGARGGAHDAHPQRRAGALARIHDCRAGRPDAP